MNKIYGYFLILFFVLTFSFSASAQPVSKSSLAKFVTALPSPNTCNENDKNQAILFLKNVGLYKCVGGTYTAVAGSSGGGSTTELGVADSADYGNNLNSAIAAIGSNPIRLKITGPTTATASTTIPKNIPMSYGELGYLTVNAGVIVKIANGLGLSASPSSYIFRGAGKVQFVGSYPATVYPEWFGAAGDGITDDAVPLQNALDSFAYRPDGFNIIGGGAVELSGGKTYLSSNRLVIRNVMRLYGIGGSDRRASSRIKITNANTGGVIIHQTTTETYLLDTNGNFVLKATGEKTGVNEGNDGTGTILENFALEGAVPAVPTAFTPTHTVNITTDSAGNMVIDRLTGAVFDARQGFIEGLTFNYGNTVYSLSGLNSSQPNANRLVIRPLRMAVNPLGNDQICFCDFRTYDSNWLNQKIRIDNKVYTIVELQTLEGSAKYARLDRIIESIVKQAPDGTVAANSNTLNTVTPIFSSADTFRFIYINGVNLGRISAYISPTQVQLETTYIGTALTGTTVVKGLNNYDGQLETLTNLTTANNVSVRFNIFHGIDLRARATIQGVTISNFAGDAVSINSNLDPTKDKETEPNPNNGFISNNLFINNQGNGLFLRGVNSNKIDIQTNDFTNNQGWGVFDRSFLGNNYFSNHTSFNRMGSNYDVGIRSVHVGDYTEGGQASVIFGDGVFYVGGDMGAGFSEIEGNNVGIFLSEKNELRTSSLKIERIPKDSTTVLSTHIGAGTSALAGESASKSLLGFSASDDAISAVNQTLLRPTWSFTYGNGGIGNGWLSFDYGDVLRTNAANSVFAVSGSQATEGAKNFWLPRGFFIGQTAGGGRTKVDTDARGIIFDKNIAAPTVQISAGARPICDLNSRAAFYFARGSGVTADQMQVCGRNADGTFGWSGLPTTTAITPAASDTNWALSVNGGTAAATSTFSSNYPASGTINGNRTGSDLGSGGTWNSLQTPSDASPQNLTITFNAPHDINEIDVISLRDGGTISSSIPVDDLNETGTQNMATKFDVQYWNGTAWVDLANVINNNKIWYRLAFATVNTTQIRIAVKGMAGNQQAYLAEVEAWIRN